jgi:LmbE family N-acetylglucosaminyl deacetylase
MAERLAPEHVPLTIQSRPERPRGRSGRLVRRTSATVIALVVIAALTVVTLHFLALQRTAQEIRATSLIPPEMPATVLVVLAHPGQELTMAGTLAALDEAGAQVHLLALTSGEEQPPVLESGEDRVAGIRADELAASGDLLGVEGVSVGGFADGELLAADPEQVTSSIAAVIDELGPSAILTVSDLTGRDSDSQAVSGYVLAAAQADGSPVARVWTVTRGDREVEWNALVADPIAGGEVPQPEVAVRIEDSATIKGRVLLAHGTQSPSLVEATYPYADRIPSWAYFRFWDREYFALAWGQPME